jgi:hypothetical protein
MINEKFMLTAKDSETSEWHTGTYLFNGNHYICDLNGIMRSIDPETLRFKNEQKGSKILNELEIGYIAKTCHEANRIWCQSNGDNSQKHWAEAEQWQRDSAISGVQFRLNNPNAKEDSQHNAWMKGKVDQGWVYGEVKDAVAKTHPCIVPFKELPIFQQKKDALFCAIVDALK